MSRLSSIGARHFFLLLILPILLLAGVLYWSSLGQPPKSRRYYFRMDDDQVEQVHLHESKGWDHLAAGLAPVPGEDAIRVYRFFKEADETVVVNLWFRQPPQGENVFSVQSKDNMYTFENVDSAGRPMDLTDLTTETGLLYFTFGARTNGSYRDPVLSGFRLRFSPPERPSHKGAMVFFFVCTLLFYLLLLAIIVPRCYKICREWINESRRVVSTPLFMILALVLVLICLLYLFQVSWRGEKKFDDVAAIGNAAVLLDQGFDTDYLFFRSRVRPGFLAFVQPWLRLFPTQVLAITQTPADFKHRFFYKYDRTDQTYGHYYYPEISKVCLALGCLAFFSLATLFAGFRFRPESVLLATIFTISCVLRADPIILTGTFTFFVIIIAVLFAFRATQRGDTWTWPVAGFGLSFAILTKETFVIALAPILALQIRWFWAQRSLRATGLLGLYWGVALSLPLWYYGSVISGGLAEILTNFWEHLDTQQIQSYPSLTLPLAVQNLWTVFGPLLLLSIPGFFYALRRRLSSPGDFLCFFWLLGATSTFTMPYVFPRFFQYMIPPVVYFSVCWLDPLIRNRFLFRLRQGNP